MDIPFHSSGAMSRAHYAIVGKVESSPSIDSADQHIFLEINSLHAQLSHPKLSLEKCKQCLIILLYCATLVTPGYLAMDAFDFGFHHAINLAESGTKVEDKRIGYLFCSEVMPLDHELRLMLINTIRKDLESDDVPHICLALDNLVTSPTEDIIPAVQSRLHDLLSHDYAYVRRRALLAFRALSAYNPALLQRIHGKVIKRIKDSDSSVVQAALVLARDFSNDIAMTAAVNDLLVAEASYSNDSDHDIILALLKSVKILGVMESNISILMNILLEYSAMKNPTSFSKAAILEVFQIISQLKPNQLLSAEKSRNVSAVQCIRHLLSSYKPNDVDLFMSCLGCVDVAAWAGTMPDRPSVLEGLEFERIMQLLDSPDQGIRKRTLRIVKKVDTSILDAHVLSLLEIAQTDQIAIDVNMPLLRILEIRLIQYEDDGGEYARQVLELIRKLDETTTSPQVFKGIIETHLTDIRIPSNPDFLPSCSTHFVTVLSEPDVPLGPTGLVIGAALATEFSDILPTSPPRLLSGLAARLKTCPAIAQEPCVIAMLRVRADCDEIPSDVLETMNAMLQTARRSIRFRCAQFLEFVQNKELLVKIIREAASPSLPDFLASLQNRKTDLPRSLASTPQTLRVSSRASGPSSNSLKYDAYAPPEIVPPLRTRRFSNSQQSLAGSRAETLSDSSSHHGSRSPMTAGQLTLAVGIENLQIDSSTKQPPSSTTNALKQSSLQVSRPDLISLESPFEEDTKSVNSSETGENHQSFEATWNSFEGACDLRGWCHASIDTITRRLQRVERRHLRVMSADLPPLIGELKILMVPNENNPQSSKLHLIALRLRESDDDSCLWRLRCADAGVGTQIQSILNA